MKDPSPMSLAQLAGAGTSMIVCVVAGLLLGLFAAHYSRWDFAVPVGVIFGFAAGIVLMFRRLSSIM